MCEVGQRAWSGIRSSWLFWEVSGVVLGKGLLIIFPFVKMRGCGA